MARSRSRRCSVCRKLYASAGGARDCERKGEPERRFQVGDTVYPRFTGLPGTPMAVHKLRIVRGTHGVECGLRRLGLKGGRITWVPQDATYGSREAREAQRSQERCHRQPLKAGCTASAKASYRVAFAHNREFADGLREQGRTVHVYFCRSRNHGRTMRFFTAEVSQDACCPACGADQVPPPEGGRVPIEYQGPEAP